MRKEKNFQRDLIISCFIIFLIGLLLGIGLGAIPIPDSLLEFNDDKTSKVVERRNGDTSESEKISQNDLAALQQKLTTLRRKKQDVKSTLNRMKHLKEDFQDRLKRVRENIKQAEEQKTEELNYKGSVVTLKELKQKEKRIKRHLDKLKQPWNKSQEQIANLKEKEQQIQDKISVQQIRQITETDESPVDSKEIGKTKSESEGQQKD